MVIYKYEIPIPNEDGNAVVIMPKSAEILSVKLINDRMCLWALVSPRETEKKSFSIKVVNTGVPDLELDLTFWKFLATLISTNGIVWHVFC